MELHELAGGVVLLNDSYNANPESMRAALDAVASIGEDPAVRRTVAVLGEMRELGDTAATAHTEIGALTTELGIDRLLVVGAGALGIAEGAAGGPEVFTAPDVDAAHAVLQQLLSAGDVVLFKSSRDSGLRLLGDRITVESGGRIPT